MLSSVVICVALLTVLLTIVWAWTLLNIASPFIGNLHSHVRLFQVFFRQKAPSALAVDCLADNTVVRFKRYGMTKLLENAIRYLARLASFAKDAQGKLLIVRS